MQKYRLEWQGVGSLDLSQILDEHGVPVIFPRPGAVAIVDARTFAHPHVQNYLKAGLVGTLIGPGATPVIKVDAPPAPPAPPPSVPEVTPPPVVSDSPPEPKPVTVSLGDTVSLKETEVAVTTTSETDSTEPEASPDIKRRRGRGK
jgi:hypothetical protein